jgi:hypothetical protein
MYFKKYGRLFLNFSFLNYYVPYTPGIMVLYVVNYSGVFLFICFGDVN